MARQKGLIKVVGTLGDVNFYISKGVGYARKAGGGFNGAAIKTKASMQRVRENASEFGHCSQVKKHFRMALRPFLDGIRGRDLHSRLMQLFLELKALDAISERGKRRVYEGVHRVKGTHLLSQFEFTPEHSLLDALYAKTSFDWTTQRLYVNDFSPYGFNAPKGSTHVGVTLGILDFDFDLLTYRLEVSAPHFLAMAAPSTSFVLVPELMVPPTHYGIAVLGLRYYEVIDNDAYGLDTNVGLRILDCLV